ncbi:FapA family protein [Gracilibacillus lacisalsi]|uniref:FapA family protein n=1 Tax=Gracilibacillus lacisalsi TaxID=393087 RepID=UPI000363DDBC|nr:FapA family protein [Gracilibacillus lacisalsi]
MNEIKEKIDINISKNRLVATLYVKDPDAIEDITEEDIQELLKSYNIEFGVMNLAEIDWKQKLIADEEFIIAEGKKPENGTDGKLIVKQSTDSSLAEEEKTNFRDITRIPMVETNDILAQLIPPTDGEQGMDIFHNPVKQRKGKPYKCRSGENVSFDESTYTFIATSDGQLSVGDQVINVYPLYEVNGDLSLETGNIQFNGSVMIKGNVPTGYSVTANGDVTVYGIVEASYIHAGGNVLIREGIAGMEKAIVTADADIEVGYINQAEVTAGRDLKVKKSIMHSNCVAQHNLFCTNGSIIGGSCSAGKIMEVKNLGNLANSKTELAFGISKKILDRVSGLKQNRKELKENQQKLRILGDQLKQKKDAVGELPTKERIMLLKQRNMLDKTNEKLQLIEDELNELEFEIGNYAGMKLMVKGKAYENVELMFGKYKRVLYQEHQYFQAYLEEKEITIQSL